MPDIEDKNILDVFVTTYNRAHFLEECIRSILKQTYTKYELVILDNCSTDNTSEVVQAFNDVRIRYIRHDENIGAWGNICYAYEYSSKKFFVIFHDDDIMLPNFLETELAIMEENSDIAAISCITGYIDKYSNMSIPEETIGNERIIRYSNKKLLDSYINERNVIMFPTIMYRTEFLRINEVRIHTEAGPSADMLLSMDIEKAGGTIAIINRYMVCYRRHEEQWSQIARVEMVYKLFKYMKEEPYYQKVLENNKKGQSKYYQQIIFNELCLFASEKISIKELSSDKRVYEEVMDLDRYTKISTSLLVAVCKIFPQTIKWLYCYGKKIKSRIYK